jgi:zinc D-Ala-D-Ala dipeptidase
MKRADVYKLLEDKMLTYAELEKIPVSPVGEPELVPLAKTDSLSVNPVDPDMAPVTGADIYVRKDVAAKVGAAGLALARERPELRLEVVYGYRTPSIQRANFDRQMQALSGQYEGPALIEAAHRRVAHPEVAGHPTGAAVDVQIVQGGQPLDFGTRQREFVEDSYTYSPYISREAWFNRGLLQRVMTGAGFAPFEGEWWHFSYGDREWAKYYNQPAAIYEQTWFRPGQ